MSSPEPEGALVYLQNLNEKKNAFQKALLRVLLHSKDLDNDLDSSKICFDQSLADLDTKEKNLECVQDSLVKSKRELELVRESLEAKSVELETEKENFRNFQQKQMEDFEKIKEQLSIICKENKEKSEEVELREVKLGVEKKLMEVLLGKIEMEKVEFVGIQNHIAEKLSLIKLKEKSIVNRSKELEGRAKDLDSREEKLDTKAQLDGVQKWNNEKLNEAKKLFGECVRKNQEPGLIEKQIEVREEKLEVSEKLDIKEQELEATQRLIKERAEKLDIREQELDAKEKQVKKREEELEAIRKLDEEHSKKLNIRAQELDAAEKLINIQAKELRLREEKMISVSKEKPAHTSPEMNVTPAMLIVSSPESSPSSPRTIQYRNEKRKRLRKDSCEKDLASPSSGYEIIDVSESEYEEETEESAFEVGSSRNRKRKGKESSQSAKTTGLRSSTMNPILKFVHVFLLQSSSQNFLIPSEFVTRMKGALPNQAVLRNGNRKLWLVTISKVGEKFFLGDGWPKFVKDNSVKHGDFLLFEYDGQTFFDVKIYDGQDSCEKDPSSRDGIIDVSESEYEEETEESAFEVGSSRNRKRKGNESSQSAKTTARKTRGKSSRYSDIDDEVFMHGIVRCPKNPYFVAKLHSSLSAKLNVPLHVIKDFHLQLPEKLDIVDEENRSWKADVKLMSNGQTLLTKGWRAFLKCNHFKSVDRCICEFILGEGNTVIHLKTTILRNGSWLPKENSF